MAQIQIDQSPNRMWIAVVAAVTIAAAITLWLRSEPSENAPNTSVSAPPSALPSTAQAMPDSAPPPPALVAEVIAEQKEVAKAIERQPVVKPITGLITERPAFVSRMEWAMLQGVAQQHANPAQELTRLVNSLRFTKQLELWQDMPRTADPTQRQAVALELLNDLPQRLHNDEMDLPAAQKLQVALLGDAVPDATQRGVRAAKEAQRLLVAASDAAASR